MIFLNKKKRIDAVDIVKLLKVYMKKHPSSCHFYYLEQFVCYYLLKDQPEEKPETSF
jgi:hypothetical protein